MRVRRERTLAADPAAVWDVVGDPGRLVEWWPRVERVESVDAAGFTEVYRTKNGRPVRADFRIAALETAREIRVVQQLEGTPFERVFSAAERRAELTPEGSGTRVRIGVDQIPAGMARFGGFMVRKAMRRQLDGALAALAELLED